MFSIIINKIAQAISYLLHPLTIPTIVFALLAIFQPDLVMPFTTDNIVFLMIFVAVFSFVIPVILIIILYYNKKISTLMLDSQEDRQIALVATSLVYIIGIYFFHSTLKLNEVAILIFAFITVCMISAMIITKFWKISLHCVGIAGLVIICGFISYNSWHYFSLIIFLITIILSGFLASARLYLNKHSLAQVSAGFVVGFGIGFIFLGYLQLH